MSLILWRVEGKVVYVSPSLYVYTNGFLSVASLETKDITTLNSG